MGFHKFCQKNFKKIVTFFQYNTYNGCILNNKIMEMLSIQSTISYKSRLKAYMVLKGLAKKKLTNDDKELLNLIIAEQLELIKEYALKHSKNIEDDED